MREIPYPEKPVEDPLLSMTAGLFKPRRPLILDSVSHFQHAQVYD